MRTGTTPARHSGGTALLIAASLVVGGSLAAFLVPVPSPAELRGFTDSAGPAMPIVFLGMYALGTALPLPRTAFSLASGLLLGKALGVTVAVGATAMAATLGFLLARSLGGNLAARFAHRTSIRVVDERITASGVLGVASLRLIPVIPFAPLSYCCGMSSVRLAPYLLGTVIGTLPGTTAVVILGDALVGAPSPVPAAWYVSLCLLGAFGVYRMVRQPSR